MGICGSGERGVGMRVGMRVGMGQVRRPLEPQFESACAKFLTWFIENYPESAPKTRKATPDFWTQFK